MNRRITEKLKSLLSRRELKERLARIALVMSCFAVFCITYVLVAPVSTEEWPTVCGMEEHIHDESCYTEQLVEPQAELVCGLEETGHTHTDACYEMHRGDLMCAETGTEEEPHEHSDACYAWSYELACGESEEGHIHDESCYAVTEEPHTELVLTCGLPEHEHEDRCYQQFEEETSAPEYICGYLEAHTHTEECYFESGDLKCTVPEHTHTGECLAVEEKLPELGEDEELMHVDEQFTYENEDVTITFTVQGEVPVRVREMAAEETETPAMEEPEETAVQEEPAEAVLELTVTEPESQELCDAYEARAEEAGEVMMIQVLDYALTLNGETLDLSACEVDVAVAPKPALQEWMGSPITTYSLETEEADTAIELLTYSEEPGVVAYALALTANPSFTVQYYAVLERVVQTADGKLPIIDTEGGKLPVNATGYNNQTNGLNISSLSLNEDGSVKTQETLTEIYRSEKFTYHQAPGLMYFNIVLQNETSEYRLDEIWILNEGKNPTSEDKADWTVYEYSATTRFTNRPETAEADSNFILIEDGALIRLVYGTKATNRNFPANFYDYDITDMSSQRIYLNKEARNENKSPFYVYTSEKNEWEAALKDVPNNSQNPAWTGIWLKTKETGINSASNYTGTGTAKLAFGNSNMGTGLDGERWSKNALNRSNGSSAGPYANDSYKGCTFGLAKAMKDGKIVYGDGVDAPKLFNEGAAKGKTSYDNGEYSLDFQRVGDTYTLSAVRGTTATNLDKFVNPQSKYPNIWTNNFWPMDSAPSWGTAGHDPKMGNAGNNVKIYNSDDKNVPPNDDGKDHNSYFGMQYAVKFDLSASYIGPLEYYFFGDDDMWVFLNDELVCDIGGVHSSVGEYVNLWDYIDRRELLNEDGTPKKVQKEDPSEPDGLAYKKVNGQYVLDEAGNRIPEMTDYVKTYTLTFYYTERGASGSTCWMQFTLPTVVGLNLESALDEQVNENTGSLSVEKQLEGVENVQWFEFELELSGKDNYDLDYLLRDANGNLIDNEELKGDADYIADGSHFRIRAGDVLVVRGLPLDTEYTIKELTTNGYHTRITTGWADSDETETVNGTEISGKIERNTRTKVTFVNMASYEMPATGGCGVVIFYALGTLLVFAGTALWVYNQKLRGKAKS